MHFCQNFKNSYILLRAWKFLGKWGHWEGGFGARTPLYCLVVWSTAASAARRHSNTRGGRAESINRKQHIIWDGWCRRRRQSQEGAGRQLPHILRLAVDCKKCVGKSAKNPNFSVWNSWKKSQEFLGKLWISSKTKNEKLSCNFAAFYAPIDAPMSGDDL